MAGLFPVCRTPLDSEPGNGTLVSKIAKKKKKSVEFLEQKEIRWVSGTGNGFFFHIAQDKSTSTFISFNGLVMPNRNTGSGGSHSRFEEQFQELCAVIH